MRLRPPGGSRSHPLRLWVARCAVARVRSPCSFPLHAIPFSAVPSPSELGLSEDSFWKHKKGWLLLGQWRGVDMGKGNRVRAEVSALPREPRFGPVTPGW